MHTMFVHVFCAPDTKPAGILSETLNVTLALLATQVTMDCFVPLCAVVSTLTCCVVSVMGGLMVYGKHNEHQQAKGGRRHGKEGYAEAYVRRLKAGEVSFGVAHDQHQLAIDRAAQKQRRPDGLFKGINFRSDRVSDSSHIAVRSGYHHPSHPYI